MRIAGQHAVDPLREAVEREIDDVTRRDLRLSVAEAGYLIECDLFTHVTPQCPSV